MEDLMETLSKANADQLGMWKFACVEALAAYQTAGTVMWIPLGWVGVGRTQPEPGSSLHVGARKMFQVPSCCATHLRKEARMLPSSRLWKV